MKQVFKINSFDRMQSAISFEKSAVFKMNYSNSGDFQVNFASSQQLNSQILNNFEFLILFNAFIQMSFFRWMEAKCLFDWMIFRTLIQQFLT